MANGERNPGMSQKIEYFSETDWQIDAIRPGMQGFRATVDSPFFTSISCDAFDPPSIIGQPPYLSMLFDA
jgi:hypothetical protein